MAGKHSKSFFDFKQDIRLAPPQQKRAAVRTPVSLPFKIIIAVLVVSLALSAIFVGVFFGAGNANKKLLTESASLFEQAGSSSAIKTLANQNSDIKGWLKINGTSINNAVCQTDNDSYYINHNQLGKKSSYGALFLSSADSFERKDNDRNIVIFGNNMKDGSMFGTLKKYRNLNFYKQNPYINLYYGQEEETYVIFAVMLIASSEDDAGEIYNPSKSHFASKDEFDAWYSETVARSLINTTVTANYGDDMLTLVTVADDFDGARLVVMAKKATDWEASHTDVSSASVNPKIKYPKIWYTDRGLKYPFN